MAMLNFRRLCFVYCSFSSFFVVLKMMMGEKYPRKWDFFLINFFFSLKLFIIKLSQHFTQSSAAQKIYFQRISTFFFSKFFFSVQSTDTYMVDGTETFKLILLNKKRREKPTIFCFVWLLFFIKQNAKGPHTSPVNMN